jgi:hemin uptake protein HemP
MSESGDKEERGNRRADDRGATTDERRLIMTNNCIDSRDLFMATREIVILHGRDAYHLRLTAQNKLILTK